MAKKISQQVAKQLAGQAAAELIQPGMLVGIGTGSTTAYFIDALGKRCQEGLQIKAVATSNRSLQHAQQVGIPFVNSHTISYLDMTVDGADEIDGFWQMIKGGGGALLREKLLAYSSTTMVVIVDQTKVVKQLGHFPVPIEVPSFVYQTTLQRLKHLGYDCYLRKNETNQPYVTDNDNYIIDIHFHSPILDAAVEHYRLKAVIGVLETGLFFDVAKQVIVGYEEGRVDFK